MRLHPKKYLRFSQRGAVFSPLPCRIGLRKANFDRHLAAIVEIYACSSQVCYLSVCQDILHQILPGEFQCLNCRNATEVCENARPHNVTLFCVEFHAPYVDPQSVRASKSLCMSTWS